MTHRPFDATKRVFDVIAASLGLVLLSPLLLMLAAGIRLSLGRPILFRQSRPGRDARPFVIYKFRTMREATTADGTAVSDAERLTAIGRFLRAASLDELPELWNVVRGDMSLVGPRPLLMEYLPLYTLEQARRHEIRPGITGLAQVRGRNTVDWSQRFALDVFYVDHRNWILDLRILFVTLVHVVRRSGISQKGHATMPRFDGRPS